MNYLNKKLGESLFKLRMVENEISRRYSEQEMRCPVHLSTGQEAIVPIEIYSCGNCGKVPKTMLKDVGLETIRMGGESQTT